MAAFEQTSLPEAECVEIEPATAVKLHALEARLEQLGSLMVAYSGGVDSAFLAGTAHRILAAGCWPCWPIHRAWRGATWNRPAPLHTRSRCL